MKIKFYHPKDHAFWTILDQIVPPHPRLLAVFKDALLSLPNDCTIVITSFWRLDGIHKLSRALDFYVQEFVGRQNGEFAKEFNETWEYDPKRPGKYEVLQWHTVDPRKKKGWHFHLQVHDNTRRSK